MTPQLPAAVASAIVTSLEDLELPLLSWGVTSGTLSHDEVLWAIDQQLLAGDSAVDPSRVLQALLRQALLFQVPATSPPRYRTRLAETLRLTAQLRQLFPPRDLDNPPRQWWEQGRPLVADYRLLVAARLYPRRDVAVSEVMSELGRLPGWGSLQDDVARAQIADRALARFQVDAATSIFRSLAGGRGRSLVIGAGTGTGKTLAFYLPAFASMAQDALPNDARLHTLALYPRKELLRDQLREAVTVALTVNDALLKAGRRTLRIGALYGDTPHHPDDHRLSGDGGLAKVWRRDGQDLTCPYLTCPRCEADLVWPEPERRSGRETLMCRSCGLRLDDHVVLTRDALRRRPPDLLFTTTEMLNRCASDRRLGRLLGWQGGPAPSLVLLDEVHTYAGVHGAQVALLLRRWRNDVRTPATFVGLSATLRDAGAFFSELTGVEESLVDHIEPQADDLEPGGREYTLALRGDPLSGVSLLSTSIQAAMLYGRVLDVPGHEYLHGSKGFIFTDDLDVTNRFYDDLRDAEGALPRGQRARLRTGQVLAGLRSPDAPFASERFTAGQSWELVQRIGHPLSPRADANGLVIGRTSSQDSGVDRDANLIVATASLEVGYNDPHVGLVLQHKAPHDPAAFIQRRGRAGRRRSIRPWTVVILSDYGRDRLAYQAYDTLFSPEVPPRQLPVGNRFVLKIHATQALLDWLGRKLTSRGCEEDPRRLLRAPKQAVTGLGPAAPLIDLLEALLNDSILQDELAAHLQAALQISADEATALLWEQPRAVLMGVVPTALRRLRTGWRPVAQDPGASPGDLLPEYLTSTLFDPLNVPQVWLDLPFAGTDDEPLPIEKALLREAVPGRVSRRYGYRSETHRTWVPLPPPNAGGALEVAAVAPVHTRQGTWPFGTGTVEVVRPHVLPRSARQLIHNALAYNRFSPGDLAGLVALTEIALRAGPSRADYRSLLDDLGADCGRWVGPERASVALDLADLLVRAACPDHEARLRLALALLTPLFTHRDRLEANLAAFARQLSRELLTGLDWSDEPHAAVAADALADVGPLKVLLYSLDHAVLERTSQALRELAPQVSVHVRHDRVGSQQLRQHARRADIIVLATRCATHAATGFIRASASARAAIREADGSGSASLLRAAVAGLQVAAGRM